MKKLFGLVGILLVGLLCWPVRVACSAPGQTCTSAPDDKGIYYSTYSYEPLAVVLIEMLTHSNLPLEYASGQEEHQWQGYHDTTPLPPAEPVTPHGTSPLQPATTPDAAPAGDSPAPITAP